MAIYEPMFVVDWSAETGDDFGYEVRLRQNRQGDEYLPAICQRCDKFWAERICRLLNLAVEAS